MRDFFRYLRNAAILSFFMALLSCATAPLEPVDPGEVRLLGLTVSDTMRTNIHHTVTVTFEAGGEPQIRRACFYWGKDGPYCFKVSDVVYGSPGRLRVTLRPTSPGSYELECYAEYLRDGKPWPTNRVSTLVKVVY